MSIGWYAMHRGWMDDPFFGKKCAEYSEREAWIWLVENALFKDHIVNIKGHPVALQRGQMSYALRYLATAWHWTHARVQRFLLRLQEWNKIEVNSDTGQNIITICNYDEIQFPLRQNDTEEEQAKKQEQYNEATNNNKGKNGNNKNKSTFSSENAEAWEALKLYNHMAEQNGLSKAKKLTPGRAENINARLNDLGGLDGWKQFLLQVESTPFLCGDGPNFWCANLDFIIREEKFWPIIEGKYNKFAEI